MRRRVWAVKHWRARHEPDDHLRHGSRTPLQYYKRPIRGDNRAVDRQMIDAEDAAIVQRGGWELLAIRDLLLKHAGDHAHWRGYFLDRIAMRAATVRQIAEIIAPAGCPIDAKRLRKHLADLSRPEIDFLHQVEIGEVIEYIRPDGDEKGDLAPVRLVDVLAHGLGQRAGSGGEVGPGGHRADRATCLRDRQAGGLGGPCGAAEGGCAGRGEPADLPTGQAGETGGRDGENPARDPQQQNPQQERLTPSSEILGNPRKSSERFGKKPRLLRANTNTDTNADPPSASADGGSNTDTNTNTNADPPSASADGGSNANANSNADADGQPPRGRSPPTAPGGTAAGSNADPDSDTHGGGGSGPPAQTAAASDPATTPGSPEGKGGSSPLPPAVGVSKGSGRGRPAAGGKDGDPGDDQRTDGERLGAMLDEPEKLAKLVTAALGIDKGPMNPRERHSQEAAIASRWGEVVELLRRAGGTDEAIGDWAAKRIGKAAALGKTDGVLTQEQSEAIVDELPKQTAAAVRVALMRGTLRARARIWMADVNTQAEKAADAIAGGIEVSG